MTAPPLPPPPATRKAFATYQGIIGATRSVIRSRGVVAPDAIADKAGVSQATFYTYFKSKDEALAAAFDATLTEMTDDLDRLLSIEALLENGLEPSMRTMVRSVIRGFARDARIFRLAISRLPESLLVRDVYRHHETAILERLERFIRLGSAAHLVRSGNVHTMASAMLITIQGYQNPLLLRQGSRQVVDELTGMVVGLLSTDVTRESS